jgi:hypothetical protein
VAAMHVRAASNASPDGNAGSTATYQWRGSLLRRGLAGMHTTAKFSWGTACSKIRPIRGGGRSSLENQSGTVEAVGGDGDNIRAVDSGSTASASEDSTAMLGRAGQGGMTEPGDVQTLRQLEQALRDHPASQGASGASEQGGPAESRAQKGAAALASLLAGGHGSMDPAAAEELVREHQEMFGHENPLRFLSSDPHEQARLTRELQSEILQKRVGEKESSSQAMDDVERGSGGNLRADGGVDFGRNKDAGTSQIPSDGDSSEHFSDQAGARAPAQSASSGSEGAGRDGDTPAGDWRAVEDSTESSENALMPGLEEAGKLLLLPIFHGDRPHLSCELMR